MTTSTYSIEPGKRVVFPKGMLVRLMLTKYLVSVSSVVGYYYYSA